MHTILLEGGEGLHIEGLMKIVKRELLVGGGGLEQRKGKIMHVYVM